MLTHAQQHKYALAVSQNKANLKCADCDSEFPTWASLEYRVLVCLNCSGAHRSLGPSNTRVKSLQLDIWNADWFQLLEIGNQTANLYWEHNINSAEKPNTNSSLQDRNKFTVNKYLKRKYCPLGDKDIDPIIYATKMGLLKNKVYSSKQQSPQQKPPEPIQVRSQTPSKKQRWIPDFPQSPTKIQRSQGNSVRPSNINRPVSSQPAKSTFPTNNYNPIPEVNLLVFDNIPAKQIGQSKQPRENKSPYFIKPVTPFSLSQITLAAKVVSAQPQIPLAPNNHLNPNNQSNPNDINILFPNKPATPCIGSHPFSNTNTMMAFCSMGSSNGFLGSQFTGGAAKTGSSQPKTHQGHGLNGDKKTVSPSTMIRIYADFTFKTEEQKEIERRNEKSDIRLFQAFDEFK